MMMNTIYARSLEGKPHSEWQTLREHSVNVAHLASATVGSILIGALQDGILCSRKSASNQSL